MPWTVANLPGNCQLLDMSEREGGNAKKTRLTWPKTTESRLIGMEALTALPDSSRKTLTFSYDGFGRRIQKVVHNWNAAGSSYQVQSTAKYVYDGWNLIGELDGGGAVTRSYMWGMDLSGSLQ